jgi:hypothetical protein
MRQTNLSARLLSNHKAFTLFSNSQLSNGTADGIFEKFTRSLAKTYIHLNSKQLHTFIDSGHFTSILD